jgi:hypothetical protein
VQGLVLDEPHPARADGADAVVEHLQVQALEVRNVTGDDKGDDLALALGCHLVDAGKAAQDQTGSGGLIPFAHDVLTVLDRSHLHRQGFEDLALVIGEDEHALELADKRIVARVKG